MSVVTAKLQKWSSTTSALIDLLELALDPTSWPSTEEREICHRYTDATQARDGAPLVTYPITRASSESGVHYRMPGPRGGALPTHLIAVHFSEFSRDRGLFLSR